jgi:hypothetical protein
MTALARAALRRGDGMTTVHNNNSRQQKKAPGRTGAKLKDMTSGTDTNPPARAQY